MMRALLTCLRQIQCEIARCTPTKEDRAAARMLRDGLWDEWTPEWERLHKVRKTQQQLNNGEQVCTTTTHTTAFRLG